MQFSGRALIGMRRVFELAAGDGGTIVLLGMAGAPPVTGAPSYRIAPAVCAPCDLERPERFARSVPGEYSVTRRSGMDSMMTIAPLAELRCERTGFGLCHVGSSAPGDPAAVDAGDLLCAALKNGFLSCGRGE